MIRAYDEMYLDDAMECLGAAVEYGVLFCGMDVRRSWIYSLPAVWRMSLVAAM